MVFLDLKLPYLSGHEVLEWMRTQPDMESLPVVILSGSDEGRDHVRATSNGAQQYLLKPPDSGELGNVIDTALSNSP